MISFKRQKQIKVIILQLCQVTNTISNHTTGYSFIFSPDESSSGRLPETANNLNKNGTECNIECHVHNQHNIKIDLWWITANASNKLFRLYLHCKTLEEDLSSAGNDPYTERGTIILSRTIEFITFNNIFKDTSLWPTMTPRSLYGLLTPCGIIVSPSWRRCYVDSLSFWDKTDNPSVSCPWDPRL